MNVENMMKAVVYHGINDFCLEDRPMPEIIDPKDAVIKVVRSSICASDLHIIHGAVPFANKNIALGHEFVGEVVAVGKDVKNFRSGDRVAVNCIAYCGDCYFCRHGFVNNCVHGGWLLGCTIDGGQAEYARVPLADTGLTKIPDSVSYEQALFTGDILATGYNGAELAEIKPGDTIVVIGAGPTGLCTLLSAKLYSPAQLIAIDVDDSRLQLCKDKGLADVIINPTRINMEAYIKELTNGRGADAVLEVAGGTDTFQTAWKIARPNSIVVVAAMYEEPQILPLPEMFRKNLTFKPFGVDSNKCDVIMRLIETGRIDTTPLITHHAPLNNIMEGYKVFSGKLDNCIKWVITPYEV